jgi:hypothetical protein
MSTTAHSEMMKALECLFIAVESDIAKDVRAKVWARIVELGGDDGEVPVAAADATWHIGEDGRANSSKRFHEIEAVIAKRTRTAAWTLINNGPEAFAGFLLAQLTHVEGFRPRAK